MLIHKSSFDGKCLTEEGDTIKKSFFYLHDRPVVYYNHVVITFLFSTRSLISTSALNEEAKALLPKTCRQMFL